MAKEIIVSEELLNTYPTEKQSVYRNYFKALEEKGDLIKIDDGWKFKDETVW